MPDLQRYEPKGELNIVAFQWEAKPNQFSRFLEWLNEAQLDVEFWSPYEGTAPSETRPGRVDKVIFLANPEGQPGALGSWQCVYPGDWVVRHIGNHGRLLEILSDSLFKTRFKEVESRTPEQILREKISQVEDDWDTSLTPTTVRNMGQSLKRFCDTLADAIERMNAGQPLVVPADINPPTLMEDKFCGLAAVHIPHRWTARWTPGLPTPQYTCPGFSGKQFLEYHGTAPGHNVHGYHLNGCPSNLKHLGHPWPNGPAGNQNFCPGRYTPNDPAMRELGELANLR